MMGVAILRFKRSMDARIGGNDRKAMGLEPNSVSTT